MSFFFFSRGKLKEKKTVQKWPCHRWWIGLSFFFFLSYTSVYYQKKNLSRVSRSPYLLLIQVEEEKEDKKVCCTQAHLSTSSNPPFYLSLGRFFFSFSFFKRKKDRGILLSTSAFSSSVPADQSCRQSDKYTGENRREYMAFKKI